jgi:hypothetical protein
VKEEHLDTEVVASWADGSLDSQARAAAEAHAADCVRCQAVLAAMVRTEPAAVQPGSGWLGARVRWFVPLATAAAALALWVALSTDALAPGTPPQVARRAEPTAAAEGDRAAATPAPAIAPIEALPRQIAPDETRRRPVDAAAPPPVRNEAPRPGEKSTAVAESVTVDQLRRDALRGRPVAAPTAVPPTSAEPAGAREAKAARVEEQRRDPLAGRGAPPAPPPAAAQAPPPPVPAETVAVQTQSRQSQTRSASESQVARRVTFTGAATVLGDIASPDPAVRYRIGTKGMIERTTDGGRTWIVQRSGVQTDLVAAAAPSIQVCWVIGRSGVVLLTIDGGTTWQRVPFPDATDLQTVEASDARTATVTTRGGRTFRTGDGGVNWQR